jgi:ferredoxin like protein
MTQTIEEKLYVTKFCPDTESHIKTNPDNCLICKNKECTKFCPANVFQWSEIENELIIAYENCLECGACKIGCPYEAIAYDHPKVNHGVNFSRD